jgi:hypothetical protein
MNDAATANMHVADLYKFIRVGKRKFFGFEKIKLSYAEINIADKEKAIDIAGNSHCS